MFNLSNFSCQDKYMKIGQILNEIKIDTEDYLLEDISKKGGRFYITKKRDDKTILPGSKEEGYASLENAVKDMYYLKSKSDFKDLSFEQKEKRVEKYIKNWKKKNE